MKNFLKELKKHHQATLETVPWDANYIITYIGVDGDVGIDYFNKLEDIYKEEFDFYVSCREVRIHLIERTK
jgi:hypothetical protein